MLATPKKNEGFGVFEWDYRRLLQGEWGRVYLLSKATCSKGEEKNTGAAVPIVYMSISNCTFVPVKQVKQALVN
jgi:hypothetical protein